MSDLLLLVSLLLQLFPAPGGGSSHDRAPGDKGCIGTFEWVIGPDPRPYCIFQESDEKFEADMRSRAVRDAEIERAAVMRAPTYPTSLAEVMAEPRSIPSPPADPPPVASPPVDPSRCEETVYPGERWIDAYNRIQACTLAGSGN